MNALDGTPMTWMGKKIMLHEDFVKRKRTWRERLFSWPWRPRVRFTWVKNPMMNPGNVFMFDDHMVMLRSTFREIEKRMDEAC